MPKLSPQGSGNFHMKRYNHDYSKVAEVDSLLYRALWLMNAKSYDDAMQSIYEARELLWKYRSADNMVEDNDAADGWVRSRDVMNLEDALDYLI